jgi:hypothetical protein
MTIVTRKDLVARHEQYEQDVRALETRAFPWYTNYEMGLEDGAWHDLALSSGWGLSDFGTGMHLQVRTAHDTVYLRGWLHPTSVTPPQLFANLPSEAIPEYPQHWHLLHEGTHTTWPFTVSEVDGSLTLEGAYTFPDMAQLACPNFSWPMVIPL